MFNQRGRQLLATPATLAAFALAAALTFTLEAGAVRGDPPKETTKVRIATSGDRSERVKTLQITGGPDAGRRVVMSLPAAKLRGLRAGDRLEVSAEFQVTVDCNHPQPRCIGNPYRYNPDILTQLVLAPGPDVSGGAESIELGPAKRENCRQSLPNREHHCVIILKRTVPRVDENLPCLASGCYINLVAGASHPGAGANNFVAVGGLQPNGAIPQDRGRINAVRFRPAGKVEVKKAVANKPASKKLRLDQRRELIYSQRLPNLEENDQLVVEAKATVDISKLPYNVVLSSQLVLTGGKAAVGRGPARKLATLRGEISEGNGFNCTKNLGRCTIHKIGLVRMKRDAETPSGKPRPLYASLVTRAGPKRSKARPGDRVRVISRGQLVVWRYSARVRG